MGSEHRDIFICHASEDKDSIVKPMVDAFDRANISYWYDEAEIKWGDSITQKVNEGLRISRYVIVVFSPAFVRKNWPEKELNSVLNIEASRGEIKVLPLLVDSDDESSSVIDRYPLLSDKRYLPWNGEPRKVVEELLVRLGRRQESVSDKPKASQWVNIVGASNRSCVIVNPTALRTMGFKRVYGFLRARKYQEVRNGIQEVSAKYPQIAVSSHGIYGIHDIMVSTWEEFSDLDAAKQCVQLRLWPMVDWDRTLDTDHFGICAVSRALKFRGCNVTSSQDDLRWLQTMNEPGMRNYVRTIMSGQPVRIDVLNRLGSEGIILQTPFADSDMKSEEKAQGKMEFLILVTAYYEDRMRRETSGKEDFEKFWLPILMGQDRVRTIEEVESKGSYCNADYIIHVIGDLTDLNEIVLSALHTTPQEAPGDLLIESQVVIPAEEISVDRIPALLETHKIRALEPVIFRVMEEWRQHRDLVDNGLIGIIPSVIYLVDEKTMRQTLQSYFLADQLKPPHGGAWMKDFFALSYSVCRGIATARMNIHVSQSDGLRLCRSFVMALGAEVEKQLFMALGWTCSECGLDETVFQEIINTLIRQITGKPGSFDLANMTLGSANHALDMFAAYYKDKEKSAGRLREKWDTIGDANMAVIALDQMEKQIGPLISDDAPRELRSFTETRNLLSHHSPRKTVDYTKIMEDTYFGLRIIDRINRLSMPQDGVPLPQM